MKKLVFALLTLVPVLLLPLRAHAFHDLAQQKVIDEAMADKRKAKLGPASGAQPMLPLAKGHSGHP